MPCVVRHFEHFALNHTCTSDMSATVPSAAVLADLVVTPKHRPNLRDRDTASVPGVDVSKKDAPRALEARVEQLEVLQQRLFAEDERALLVVLQGVDTSGK